MKTATQSTSTCCEGCCQTGTVCRPRYFPRQIITPDELTLEQDYFRNRLRWHNLMLHGWGVVCGARVCPRRTEDGNGYAPWSVVVERGYAIGPCGDEIVLDCPRTVDLRTPGVSGVTGDPCVEPVDPWCSDVYEAPDEEKPLYIAVRYKETRTRPVRVQPIGCGCDDSRCEYSRWCDSYEIGVLTECPTPPFKPPNGNGDRKTIPSCPESATSLWLGLAQVTVDVDGTITKIDNCFCRRLVRGAGDAWWCKSTQEFSIEKVEPKKLDPGKQTPVVVTGKGFAAGLSADFEPSGVAAGAPSVVDAETLNVTLDVAKDAASGPRTLTLTNPDCSVARIESAIAITEGTKVAEMPKREKRRSARPKPVPPPG